ncbi:MAG: tRNA uracil 4-sulfurtransferase ThiI [Spirochaetales bacterium]
MNNCTYLIKIGELTLKGANIKLFEKQLIRNTRFSLKNTGADILLRAGRMYIECSEEHCDTVEYALQHLIGITGWAKTRICEKNIESIKEAVMQEALIAQKAGYKTFKLEARRSEKSFALNSYEICREASSDVFEQGILKVDVHKPDVTVTVEVRERCFVYSDAYKGCRGLPVGTSGKGLLLLSGGLDSPVAGYRMLRRGMKIDCIYFHAYPYTSNEAQAKVEQLASILAGYALTTHIHIISFTDVQMRIKQKSEQSWATLLLRMCMMKTASMLAKHIQAKCLITGESLGQVASQTIENMAVTESACSLPLLRPLIGLDKEEIIATAVAIGTYETSILPYEDCCTLFSPKHPILHADTAEAQKYFDELDCADLLQKAFEERSIKKFSVSDNQTCIS